MKSINPQAGAHIKMMMKPANSWVGAHMKIKKRMIRCSNLKMRMRRCSRLKMKMRIKVKTKMKIKVKFIDDTKLMNEQYSSYSIFALYIRQLCICFITRENNQGNNL